MFILVKEIDGENVIIGTSYGRSSTGDDVTVYEIPDSEYSPDMVNSKIDSFEEM
jgi:hypothetical protein